MAYTLVPTELIVDGAITSAKLDTNIAISGTLGVTGEVTLATHLVMGDNDKIKIGTGGDLEIYHDGSNSYISNSTGNLYLGDTNGSVHIQAKLNEESIICAADGAVTLYHDNAVKLATTSTGIDVTSNDSTNNSVSTLLKLSHTTTGTATDGIGTRINFESEDDGGTVSTMGYIDTLFTDVSDGAEKSAIQFYTRSGGSIARQMHIDSTGVGISTTANVSTSNSEQGFWYENNGWMAISRSGNTTAYFNRLSSDGDIVAFRKDGTTVGSIGSRGGAVSYIVLDPRASGAGLTATNDAILPSDETGDPVNNNTDLGTSSIGFKDLYLSGTANVGGLTTTGDINFGDSDKAIFGTGSDLQIYHDGSNSYINDVGTGSLYIKATNLSLSDAAGEQFLNAYSNGGVVLYHDNAQKLETTATGIDVTGTVNDLTLAAGNIETNTSNNLSINTPNSLRINIDSNNSATDQVFVIGHNQTAVDNNNALMTVKESGNVGIGTSSPDHDLHIESTDPTLILAQSGSLNNANSGRILFAESPSYTTVDAHFEIKYDGLENHLYFGSPLDQTTDLFVVGRDGKVGIGTDSAATELHVKASSGDCELRLEAVTNSDARLRFGDATDNDAGYIGYNRNSGFMNFSALNTAGEAMRLDTSGNLLVGTSSPSLTNTGFVARPNDYMSYTNTGDAGDRCLLLNKQNATGTIAEFRTGNVTKGTISVSSSSTAYNTSSDGRLKEVTGSARGLEVINELNPVAYNWKADGQADEGLIAQEVLDIVPNAVSGSEEEYYQMDYSKLVVHLVAGMKEQQTIIDDLKSRIETLEG